MTLKSKIISGFLICLFSIALLPAQEKGKQFSLDDVKLLTQQGLVDSAYSVLSNIIENDPYNDEALMMRAGFSLFVQNDHEKVCNNLKSIVVKEDSTKLLMVGIAAVYLQRKEIEKAQDVLDICKSKFTETSSYYNIQGGVYLYNDNFKGAIECYEKCLEEDREQPLILNILCRSYFSDIQLEKSFEAFKEYAALNPEVNKKLDLLEYITSGVYWTKDHLIKYLESKDFAVSTDNGKTYCYYNTDDDYISFNDFETSIEAKNFYQSKKDEYILSDEYDKIENYFLWGSFCLFRNGQSDECNKKWMITKDLLENIAVNEFRE